jgi:hypothetical protein
VGFATSGTEDAENVGPETSNESHVLTDWGGYDESVTLNSYVLLRACVGVPERLPLLESASPVGSCPTTVDHVYGSIPPEAVKFAEYGVPVVAGGRDVVVIARGVTADE